MFAQSAISDLRVTLKIVEIKNMPDVSQQEEQMKKHGFKEADMLIPETSTVSLTQTLGIAYYNLAVEFEHTSEYVKAKAAYDEALHHASESVNTE